MLVNYSYIIQTGALTCTLICCMTKLVRLMIAFTERGEMKLYSLLTVSANDLGTRRR